MAKTRKRHPETIVLDVLEVLADPDRERRRQNLTVLIVEVRNRRRRLAQAEGTALFRAWREEAVRPGIDGLTYHKLWLLLEHSPAVEEFTPFAQRIMEDQSLSYRGSAASYLLHAYPEQRDAFIARYDQDPDPEVQNALAFAEAVTAPAAARSRWARILERGGISWDLADTVQLALAYTPSAPPPPERPGSKSPPRKRKKDPRNRTKGSEQRYQA